MSARAQGPDVLKDTSVGTGLDRVGDEPFGNLPTGQVVGVKCIEPSGRWQKLFAVPRLDWVQEPVLRERGKCVVGLVCKMCPAAPDLIGGDRHGADPPLSFQTSDHRLQSSQHAFPVDGLIAPAVAENGGINPQAFAVLEALVYIRRCLARLGLHDRIGVAARDFGLKTCQRVGGQDCMRRDATFWDFKIGLKFVKNGVVA